MTYRNDLEAANGRIEALERERRELLEQHARLNRQLAPQATKRVRPKQRWRRRIANWFSDAPRSEHAPDDIGLGIVAVAPVVFFIIMVIAAVVQR